jgi:hypothetical protein
MQYGEFANFFLPRFWGVDSSPPIICEKEKRPGCLENIPNFQKKQTGDLQKHNRAT